MMNNDPITTRVRNMDHVHTRYMDYNRSIVIVGFYFDRILFGACVDLGER